MNRTLRAGPALSPGTSSLTAAAIVNAKRIVAAGEQPDACVCCGREAPFVTIVVQKRGAVGRTEGPGAELMAGICAECAAATSDGGRQDVAQLATAAARVDALLTLVRHRAAHELASWWGGVGACSVEDVDRASVELRRSLERLGVKP